jgi:hydrogenase nickel incorporation protein HypA/HybF
MHELSIAHSILSIAERTLPLDSKGYISGISLQIGELSGIELDALRFAFEAIKDGSLLAKAELNIDIIAGEAECSECGTVFHMPGFATPCPQCQSYLAGIRQGKELKVLSITVEE